MTAYEEDLRAIRFRERPISGRIDTMKRTMTVPLVGGPFDDTEVEVDPRKVVSGGALVFARVHDDFTGVYGPNRMATEVPMVYDTYIVKLEHAEDERLYGYFAEWVDPTPPDSRPERHT